MHSLARTLLTALAATFALGAAGPVAAQSLVSTGQSFLSADLVAGRPAALGGRTAGLVLDIAPGWKTYWRHPGAAGVPPRFDWSRSQNLRSVQLLWPRPVVFDSFGMMTLGYAGRVVFPLRLEPEDPARPIRLELDMAVGLCHEICVLEETALSLEIAPGAPEAGGALVAAAEAQVPRPASESGMTEAACRITGAGAERGFEAVLHFATVQLAPQVILEGPETTWFRDVRATADGTEIRVTAAMSLLDAGAWVDRSALRMTLLGDGEALDVQGCGTPPG